MTNESLLTELRKKDDNAELIIELILQDLSLVRGTIYGIASVEARTKFKCIKVLRTISKIKPAILYPYFHFFERLLDHENNIIKWNAIDIIANLAEIDTGRRFDKIFNRYYELLNEGSLITAGHIVDNSGKIAKVKHNLREQITNHILSVERVSLPTDECRSILNGKAILALGQYLNHIRNNDAVIAFAKRQINSKRSATKNKAEELLRKIQRES